MRSKHWLVLLALLAAVMDTSSAKRRGGNVGALFAAGLGGSALGLSYGVLLAGQHHRGGKGDHHHIYNYAKGGGDGGSEVQVINAHPHGYSNPYGAYLGGYGYGVPYAG